MFIMRFAHRKTKIYKQFDFLKRAFNDLHFEDIPNVSPTEIKKTLTARSINFEEGYTCFIVACPMCHKPTKTANAATNKVYINKTTGMFLCPSCKSSGQWNSFETYLTSKRTKKGVSAASLDVVNEKDVINNYLEKVNASTISLKTIGTESVVNVLKNFNLPVLNNKSLDILDVRINDSYKNLYFPLENAEASLVGYQILNNRIKMPRIEPTETCGGMLVGKSVKSKDTAIIVPNIADFIVLLNSKISGNVVCLPSGYTSLSQYILPAFERYNKLILWFGNDVKSWDIARNFAKKLGEKRCLFVRPTDKQLLPHLAKEDQDFKAIISSAQPIWHKSITTFSSLREDVLSDLQNIDKVQGVKWKRFPTLNKILKGHRKGELTVLTGPTGSGKTTFISEYSLDLAMQGVNTLWGSFEIRNARLARTMLQQMAGMLLDTNIDKFDYWADQFEQLPLYFMTFHGQQAVKVVMEAVEHATYVHDISHVIIDNVQFMMGMGDEPKHSDRFWKQDLIVAAFRNFATRKNCHITLIIHPRKEREDEDLTTSSIFGGAKASQEADNVLIIQDKRLTSVRGKKYLQVAKNRYSGDLGIMALDFDKSSLSYAQKKKKVPEERTSNKSNEKMKDDKSTDE